MRNYSATKYVINESFVYIKKRSLTCRWVRGFKAAIEAASQSDGDASRDRLGAAIFHGNRLLSTGHNLYSKTKPGNIGTKPDGSEFTISVHAEQSAVDKIKYCEYSGKMIIYVARMNALGQYVNSRPCNMCINYLRKYNINIVRFVNEFGIPEELFISHYHRP